MSAKNYLAFKIQQLHLAIALSSVVEVCLAAAIKRVISPFGLIEGICTYRGQLIPVFDLSKRLNLATTVLSPHHFFIIIKLHGKIVSLKVDAIDDIVPITDSELSDGVTIPRGNILPLMIQLSNQTLLLCDTAALLADDAEIEYNAVMTQDLPGAGE